MLNEKKIEEIRKKIQTSTLLTDHEKSDWLNLLELMNDKQLGELEEILGATSSTSLSVQPTPTPAPPISKPIAPPQAPVAPKPVPPPVPPIQKMPPLTHIANIPTDVTMPHHSVPAPDAAKPTPPAPPTPPTPPAAKPSQPPVKAHPRPVPPPKPATAPTAQPIPKRPLGITQPRYKAEKLEDIQEFSLDTIRTYDLQSVVDEIRARIQEHGYFKIVQLLESSPLYDSYINSGKERLRSSSGEQISNSSLLTQEELEFMTDLLRHMRFNRW